MILIAQFTVNGVIKPKERPRRGANGRTYTPQATLDSEEQIAWAFRGRRVLGFETLVKFPLTKENHIRLEVDYYMPDNRGRDWDNIGKTVSDALNGIAYDDDSQIREGEVRLFNTEPFNPRAFVRIYSLGARNVKP